MSVTTYTLTDKRLTLSDISAILSDDRKIGLSETVWKNVENSRRVIEDILQTSDQAIYGITTGFGKFADVRISVEDLDELQRRIVLSHAAGVGEPMPVAVVKTMMLIKIISLSRGFSGIRPQTLQLLIEMFNNNIIPVVPVQGSVGASGDLAPLAHMAMVLIGEGEAIVDSVTIPGGEALAKHDLKPVKLHAKEGLAILNGTQAMCAYGVQNLLFAKRLMDSADLIAAMSIEALNGTLTAFDNRIHEVRGHSGQMEVAANVRDAIADSAIVKDHQNSDHRVQDAYSLRCVPQVHGAVRDTWNYVKSVVETEMNGVTDNPLIFPGDKAVLSGGNFHGEPLAFVMDFLSITMSELGNISERRIAHFLDFTMSELPAFLVREGGINSGFMMAQVTAAALASENKTLAHPASVDSIPTSANKEDHVSMGTWAARKAANICENVENILAIEYLCGAQGIDFRKPHSPALATGEAYQLLRENVAVWNEDRYMAADIKKAKETLRTNEFINNLSRYFSQ